MRLYVKSTAMCALFACLWWLTGTAGRACAYESWFAAQCLAAHLSGDAGRQAALVEEYRETLRLALPPDLRAEHARIAAAGDAIAAAAVAASGKATAADDAAAGAAPADPPATQPSPADPAPAD